MHREICDGRKNPLFVGIRDVAGGKYGLLRIKYDSSLDDGVGMWEAIN